MMIKQIISRNNVYKSILNNINFSNNLIYISNTNKRFYCNHSSNTNKTINSDKITQLFENKKYDDLLELVEKEKNSQLFEADVNSLYKVAKSYQNTNNSVESLKYYRKYFQLTKNAEITENDRVLLVENSEFYVDLLVSTQRNNENTKEIYTHVKWLHEGGYKMTTKLLQYLGHCHYMENNGNLKESVVYLNRALTMCTIETDKIPVYKILGEIHQQSGQYQQAIGYYAKAVQILNTVKSDSDEMDMIAKMAAAQQKKIKSQLEFEMADCYQLSGQVDKCKQIYQVMVKRYPENPIPLTKLASIALNSDRNPYKAIELAKEALGLYEGSGKNLVGLYQSLMTLSMAYMNIRSMSEGYKSLTRLIEIMLELGKSEEDLENAQVYYWAFTSGFFYLNDLIMSGELQFHLQSKLRCDVDELIEEFNKDTKISEIKERLNIIKEIVDHTYPDPESLPDHIKENNKMLQSLLFNTIRNTIISLDNLERHSTVEKGSTSLPYTLDQCTTLIHKLLLYTAHVYELE
ncbi:hypothetical protein DLAC_02996 [Tieghemostelium lacteum]|uniref:Uncharacterized protein n=1 Tax=Tieghemostelium lacteum TaxID=361077 RepID=A0A152A3T7_TIELA|nr:hypothetical protein DLAC_02996 [Tieghemostelium lacteum]|eukprot:KYR00933.1 hypothetical protein DLAC_02996 [Tieghemostelium lacteum]